MKRRLEHWNPVFRALDPTNALAPTYIKRFVEPRWFPASLNPFQKYVSVVALIPFTIFPHIKTVPTWQMMTEDFENGLYANKHTIVVPSSGNTAHAVARLAPAFGFKKVKVVMSTDVPDSKTGILKAFGIVNVIQVSDVAATAREEARKYGHYHLDQYSHMGNVRAHELYTGPAIRQGLASRVAVIAAAMGSGGTVAGVGGYLKKLEKTIVVGVRPTLGEQVPGARDRKKMKEVVKLPWKKVVDHVVEVSRKESFIGMRELWSVVEPQPGPTSGLAYKGLMHYLAGLSKKELKKLKGGVAAFICPDDGRFYSSVLMAELDPEQGIA